MTSPEERKKAEKLAESIDELLEGLIFFSVNYKSLKLTSLIYENKTIY